MPNEFNVGDSHLERLLAPPQLDEPWYRSLAESLRELIHPPVLPPVEVTSTPVAVKDIWGLYGRQRRSFALSVALQSGIVLLLFTGLSNHAVRNQVKEVVTLVLPLDLASVASPVKPLPKGGGGGGDRSLLPASRGRLPRAALRQFVPPAAVLPNPAPKLSMEPSILAPPDVILPSVNMANFGDPLAAIGPPSNGPGSGSGIGSGKGGGVGSGTGGGVGPGEGGGIGGGVYALGSGGVTAPIAIYRPDPDFSDEARKARLQGTVVLDIIVDETGKARNIRVRQSLGLGLDEQAIKTLQLWRFKPGTKGGRPVAVWATVHVGFHLL